MNITLKNLNFKYKNIVVFDNAQFYAESKDIIGLIGSNASGKSTLLNIISYQFQKEVTFMKDNLAFYNNLSIFNNLKYYCIINKLNQNKIIDYLNLLKIDEYNNYKLNKVSLGTRQKVNICKCLLNDKNIYLFDEPLNGLDPSSIIIFKKIIKNLNRENKIIIISSHNLEFIEQICNKVYVINGDNKIHKIKNKALEREYEHNYDK